MDSNGDRQREEQKKTGETEALKEKGKRKMGTKTSKEDKTVKRMKAEIIE